MPEVQRERDPLALHRHPGGGTALGQVGRIGHERTPSRHGVGIHGRARLLADLLQAVEADETDATGSPEVLGQKGRGAARHHRHHAEPGAQLGEQRRHALERAGNRRIVDDRRQGSVEVEEHRRGLRVCAERLEHGRHPHRQEDLDDLEDLVVVVVVLGAVVVVDGGTVLGGVFAARSEPMSTMTSAPAVLDTGVAGLTGSTALVGIPSAAATASASERMLVA